MYIYIYIERERDIMCIYIYIYMYMYIYIYIKFGPLDELGVGQLRVPTAACGLWSAKVRPQECSMVG